MKNDTEMHLLSLIHVHRERPYLDRVFGHPENIRVQSVILMLQPVGLLKLFSLFMISVFCYVLW